MKSFIPWVGGKSKLLWLIHKLSPSRYSRFIDVFGGSGTVTLSRPIQQGCMEVYNDFNGDLTNLFCCVKNRTMALLLELGFLPLNTRDDFNVLYKFFSREEFTDDYLDEEITPFPDYPEGIYLRYLHTDILWFLKAKDRFRSKPSWFNFTNSVDQIWAPDDPLPFFTYSLQGLAKLRNDRKKRKL